MTKNWTRISDVHVAIHGINFFLVGIVIDLLADVWLLMVGIFSF